MGYKFASNLNNNSNAGFDSMSEYKKNSIKLKIKLYREYFFDLAASPCSKWIWIRDLVANISEK